ncbi:MAG: FAD:protein FMN transferase [Pseudomonadota bacterium]
MLLATFLWSCGKPSEPLYQEQLLALGALVDITIWGAEPGMAQAAGNALTEDFNRIHNTWHAWKPSALTRINEGLRNNGNVSVDAELLPLLRRAQELSLKSNNLFNPAVGKLIALWGFHSDEPKGPPPDAQAVARLVARHPTMADLRIDGATLRSANPALQLDFGAIGQGYAVDVAVEHLRALGIHNAIVNASGDIRVIGKRGERPWRIGIRDPRGQGIIASIEMQGDESIVTSGTYERYFEYHGQRYHHILDPRSGYPARGAISVTVLHGDAVTADAASTALLVAGPKDWIHVARSMGVKQAMLIDTAGVVHIDPLLAKRIHFEAKSPPKVELSEPL